MAIQYTATRTKNVHEFQMNLEKIMELENADPEFTLFDLVNCMGEKVRFTRIEQICNLIGWTYKDMLAEGYTYEDLANIVAECVEELGFTSEPPEQSS